MWVGTTDVTASKASISSSQANSSLGLTDILSALHILGNMTFVAQDYTDVQKADILITHQWLRLVFWQAAMKQGFLSSTSPEAALRYDFPCTVARSLCEVIPEISREAICIHGVAIVSSRLVSFRL
jgi:hypothetical protein